MISRICLLGFGEVGQVFAAELGGRSEVALAAYDKLFSDPESLPSRTVHSLSGIKPASEPGRAAEGCQLVISAVTADQSLSAAKAVVPGLEPGAWFVDVNSTAPDTKRRVASAVEDAGGRYVEATIMAPIEPKRLAVPVLLGGPHARVFESIAMTLGFEGARYCSSELGAPAATKMCRSVIVKGLEALVTESLLAARHYGVEESVLGSLGNLFSGEDWPELSRYLISRSLEHGSRRAAEMREAAQTIADAGIVPWMSQACVERLAWAGGLSVALESSDLNSMLDVMLSQHSESAEEAKSS